MPLLYPSPDRTPVVVLVGCATTEGPLWASFCDTLPTDTTDLRAWVAESWEGACDGGGVVGGTGDTEAESMADAEGWGPDGPPPCGDLIGQGQGLPTEWPDGEPLDYPEPDAEWRVYRTTVEGWTR